MVQRRSLLGAMSGSGVYPARIRPLLDIELIDQDGRVDRVVVDAILRGEYVPRVTQEELDEVCRVLTDLRIRYHGSASVRPGTTFNDRSPYREALASCAHAFGDTVEEFNKRVERYRDKMLTRERRERQRTAKEGESDG